MAKKRGMLTDALGQIGSTKRDNYADEAPTIPKNNTTLRNHTLSENGRKRFNTMLSPSLKKRLLNYGHDNQMTIADIFEQLAADFLNKEGY